MYLQQLFEKLDQYSYEMRKNMFMTKLGGICCNAFLDEGFTHDQTTYLTDEVMEIIECQVDQNNKS